MNATNPEMIDAAQTLSVALDAIERALLEDEAIEQDAIDACQRLDRLAEGGIPVQALLCIAARRELAKTVCLQNVPYAWRLLNWAEDSYIIYDEDDLMHGINDILRVDPAAPRSVQMEHMEPHPLRHMQYFENVPDSAKKFIHNAQRPKPESKNEFMWFDRLCVFDSASDAWKLRRAASLTPGSHKTQTQALRAASRKESPLGFPSNMRYSFLQDVKTCHCLYERFATGVVTIANLRFAVADEVVASSFVRGSLAAVCQQFEALAARPDKWVFQVHTDAQKCGIPSLAASLAAKTEEQPATSAAEPKIPPSHNAQATASTHESPPHAQQHASLGAGAASASSWVSAALSETPPPAVTEPMGTSLPAVSATALQPQAQPQRMSLGGFVDSHQDFDSDLGFDRLSEAAAMTIGIDDQLRGMIGVSTQGGGIALPGAAQLWAAPGDAQHGAAWPTTAAQPPASQGLALPVASQAQSPASQGLALPVASQAQSPGLSGTSSPALGHTPPRMFQPAADSNSNGLHSSAWLGSRQRLAQVAALAFRELGNAASGMSSVLAVGTVSMHKFDAASSGHSGWPESVTVSFVANLQGMQGLFSIPCTTGASAQCAELQAALQPWQDGELEYTIGRVLRAADSRAALVDTNVEHLRLVCTPRSADAAYAQRAVHRLQQLSEVAAADPACGASILLPEAVNKDTGAMCFKLSAGTLAQRMQAAAQAVPSTHMQQAADTSTSPSSEFEADELEGILRQTTQALAAVHGASPSSLSHGDLHEGQVHIMPSGKVRLGGWFSPAVLNGVSSALFRSPPPAGQQGPIPGGGSSTLQSSDVWQLGALAYSAATSGGSIWGVYRTAWGLRSAEGELAARSCVLSAWEAHPWRRSRVSQADMPNVPRRCLASAISLMVDLQPNKRPGCELLLRHPGLLPNEEYCSYLEAAERLQRQCTADNENDPWRIIASQIGQHYPPGYQQWMSFVRPNDTSQLLAALQQENSFVHHRAMSRSEVPSSTCSTAELAHALVGALSYAARAGNVQQLLESGGGNCEWIRRSRTCGWLAGAIGEGHLDHTMQLEAVARKALASAKNFEDILS